MKYMQAVDTAIRKGRIVGHIKPGFELLLEAFSRNFNEFGDVGAACTVYHRGNCVADLWGGLADETSGRTWEENTIALVFSAAKGPTATCINRLAEQGLRSKCFAGGELRTSIQSTPVHIATASPSFCFTEPSLVNNAHLSHQLLIR